MKMCMSLLERESKMSNQRNEPDNCHCSLFTHVKMKVLVQSVRLVVYSIIDNFMARHRDGELPHLKHVCRT